MSPFNPPRNYQGAGKYAVPPNFQVGNVQFNQPVGMEGSSADNGQEMVQENANRYPTNTYEAFNQGMLILFLPETLYIFEMQNFHCKTFKVWYWKVMSFWYIPCNNKIWNPNYNLFTNIYFYFKDDFDEEGYKEGKKC